MAIQVPRGIRNNNPLNIRRGSYWRGLSDPQEDSQFCQFATMTYGCRAAIVLARNHLAGRTSVTRHNAPRTLSQFINVWAPPTENDTENYINAVCLTTGYKPTTPVNNETLLYILYAMAKVETGQFIPMDTWEAALRSI